MPYALTSYPPGLPFLQGGALGLDRVVNDTARPSWKVHGDQGVLRHAPLFPRDGNVAGGWWVGGGVESRVEGGTQGLKGEGVGEGLGGRQEVRGQTSQTQSLGHDKSCLHTGPLQSADVAAWKSSGSRLKLKTINPTGWVWCLMEFQETMAVLI